MEKQQKIDTWSIHSFISLPGGKGFSKFIYTFHRAWNSYISIFTVDTFNFLLNPLFRISLLGSDQLLSLIKCNFPGFLLAGSVSANDTLIGWILDTFLDIKNNKLICRLAKTENHWSCLKLFIKTRLRPYFISIFNCCSIF